MKLSDIGSTILLEIDKFKINDNRVFSKCEYHNPIGSRKDRTFLHIVNILDKEGKIRSGMTDECKEQIRSSSAEIYETPKELFLNGVVSVTKNYTKSGDNSD
ncbi:pyridoxal-phosphate dependent enzyme [Photorhabdus luminescens]|uniref:pyridoxal-phosphate dependent enzyme n=1 Tax=Photorhabdus luminescens TaxID=29488 RepID=UPI00104361DC|nr:pyridoxal-phosphate dependent enzyme [Photorhabdus luminescens]